MSNQNIIRVGDIGRWTFVTTGERVAFGGHKARTIRVDIRASGPSFWGVERMDPDTGEFVQEFLCVTPAGMSTIEVSVDKGGLRIIPEFHKEDHVAFSAPEYERFDLEAAHPGETFLKIAHRRERNPEVEYMEFLMNHNMQARLRTMDEEIERRLAALPTERKSNGDDTGIHEQPAAKREKQPKSPPLKGGPADVLDVAGRGKLHDGPPVGGRPGDDTEGPGLHDVAGE